MAFRISELPAGTPPYLGTALLEVSVVNPGAPSGYDSRKALLSDIAAMMGDGLVISDGELTGETTLPGGGVIADTGWIGIEQPNPGAHLHIGNNPELPVNTGAFLNLDWTNALIDGEDAHGYTDTTRYGVINTDGAYASYDDRSAMYGVSDYNHHVSIQLRPVYEMQGTLNSHTAVTCDGAVLPGGNVFNWTGVRVSNPGGGGTASNCYGLIVQSQQKGSILNIGAHIAMPAFAAKNFGLLIGGTGPDGAATSYGLYINTTAGVYSRINSRLGFDVDPTAVIDLNRSVVESFWGTGGIVICSRGGATATDTTSSGTATAIALSSFGNNAIAALNATTYDDFINLRIAGPPQFGANVTALRAWALYVNSGASYFGGDVVANSRLSVGFGATGAGNLALSFIGDDDTGIYRYAADTIGIQCGGDDTLVISSGASVARMLSAIGTHASTATTTQWLLDVSPAVTPSGASLATLNGVAATPTVNASSANITIAVPFRSKVTLGSGYSGQLGGYTNFLAEALQIDGGTAIGAHRAFHASASTYGIAATTGTVTRVGFLHSGASGTSVGATINSRGLEINVPSVQPGTGAANNDGILIAGNGGTGGVNYAIRSTSTAPILVSGLIQFVGSTASFPAWKRGATTAIQARLADDSAYTSIDCSLLRTATSYTVATLPAAPGAGARAFVTDAAAPAFMAAVVGGGAVTAPVFYNGTAWLVA